MFPRISIANRGIGGDTTEGLLDRMDGILNTTPEKAFISLGYNDLYAKVPVETVFENYIKIVGELSDAGIRVYIMETVECQRAKCVRDETIALNEKLRVFAAENGYTHIELNDHLDFNIHSYDGVHLNSLGYQVWQKVIWQYLYEAEAQ